MRKVRSDKGKLKVSRKVRTCAARGCNITFECKVTSDKKYCCGGHSPAEQVEREIRTCTCGKTFEVRITSPQKYCCRSCAAHYSRLGKHHSEETKAKIGQSNSVALRGRKVSKETLEKRKFPREMRTCALLDCDITFEVIVGGWDSDRQYCSETCGHRASVGGIVSEETAAKLRKTTQDYWDTVPLEVAEARIAKAMKASRKATGERPNEFEHICMDNLDRIYPNKFKYTGDGTFLVNRHSPDAYSEELNMVALFDGVFWHLEHIGLENTTKNKKLRELIESKPFLDAGYGVFFIWEDELDTIVRYVC